MFDNTFNSKYSNVLTIILIIVIIAILALIGFLGYDFYRKYYIDKETEDFMAKYEEQIKNIASQNTIKQDNNVEGNTVIETVNTVQTNSQVGSNTNIKIPTYKGYNVLGTIEIPKTDIKYPILDRVTPKSIETSVAYYYGPGLNKEGNTTIVGHNYRSGAFFGKNKQLKEGDIIYITDNTGTKIKYTIYKTYTTTETDAEYITRQTNGAKEISLSTCTDDSKGRLIILAKE